MAFTNRERAKQLIDFSGMDRRWGMLPTDIDGFMDYRGKLFIYFEGKYKGAILPKGQQYAFEAICQSYYEEIKDKELAKYFAWVLIFEHTVPIDEDIMAKDQYVINVFSSVTLTWDTPNSANVEPKFILDSEGKLTLLNAVIQIEDWCHKNNILIGKDN